VASQLIRSAADSDAIPKLLASAMSAGYPRKTRLSYGDIAPASPSMAFATLM
jgi:hypothetical protein